MDICRSWDNYILKYILRTIEAGNPQKFRNSQPQPEIYWLYLKVYAIKHNSFCVCVYLFNFNETPGHTDIKLAIINHLAGVSVMRNLVTLWLRHYQR